MGETEFVRSLNVFDLCGMNDDTVTYLDISRGRMSGIATLSSHEK